MENQVEVPNVIYNSLEELRQSGVDMNNYKMVLCAADSKPVLRQWLGNNMKIYLQGAKYGIRPENDKRSNC